VLGGTFTERLNWRWCFWINCSFRRQLFLSLSSTNPHVVPTDGLAFLILLFFLDIRTPRTPLLAGLAAIDWLGAITVSSATVMLLLGLQFGGITFPWSSPTVICLIIFGVLTYAIFFTSQFKLSPSPIMPFSIFSNLSNLSALAVCFFDAFVFNSVAYFLPLYFQTVLSASPLQSGIWMLALAIPLSIFSACAGAIMQATGRYLELLRGGLFLMTVGTGLFINLQAYRDWARIITFLIIVGIGFGPNFHAPLIALQTRLAPKDVAVGTATFGFVRMLSGAMGVSLGQVVFQSQMKRHYTSFLDAGINNGTVIALVRGSAISSAASINSLVPHQMEVVKAAETLSFSRMWILYCVASAVGLLVSFGITRQVLTTTHEEVKTGLAEHVEGNPKAEKAIPERIEEV
jgi:MFS family permease